MVRLCPRFFPFLNLPPCCCISFGPASPLLYGLATAFLNLAPCCCILFGPATLLLYGLATAWPLLRKFSNVLSTMRNLSAHYLFKEELPTVYWMPKLHKNLYGSRFNAASNKCTTKPLSSLLTTCLTALLVHFEEYCAGICRNTGINCSWVINNAQSVLHSSHQ